MSIIEKAREEYITVRYCLSPEFLDKDYKSHLLQSIRDRYENKIFKEHGYIVEVLSIHKITREEIMSIVPNVFFMVEVRVLLYSPKIGDRLKIEIDKIFNHGVFMIQNKVRILAPVSMSEDLVIQKDFSSYYLSDLKNNVTYRRKDVIEVELIETRFEKDGFSCIGSIVV